MKEIVIEDFIGVRDGVSGDRPLIFATWIQGYYYGNNDLQKKITQEEYYKKQSDIIKSLLDTGIVKVAALKEDSDVIVGYSVYYEFVDSTTLHWVFVKKPWRGLGIARLLVPKNTTTYSHYSHLGKSILNKKRRKLKNVC